MADGIKISEMTEVTGLLGSDLIPLVSEGQNKKIKKENLFNAIRNEMIIHSETEQVVGKWIDGKNIYRKSYQYDGETIYNQKLVIDSSFKPSAIEHLIDCRLNYYKQIRTLPRDIVVPRFNAENDAVPKIHITEEDGLYISINQTYFHNFTIIIEYTKNTEV